METIPILYRRHTGNTISSVCAAWAIRLPRFLRALEWPDYAPTATALKWEPRPPFPSLPVYPHKGLFLIGAPSFGEIKEYSVFYIF